MSKSKNNPYLQDNTIPQWLFTSKAPLTPLQRLYVEYYAVSISNTVDVMNASGIEISLETATSINKLANVKLAIKEKSKYETTIAQKKARQMFWSRVMNDTSQDMKDRLKASELLGKSEKDFVEKVEHSVETDLVQAIYAARGRYKDATGAIDITTEPPSKKEKSLEDMIEGC